MNEIIDIVKNIVGLIPHKFGGPLRFYGDEFGYQNVYIIVDAKAEDNCLIIKFEYGETLKIWDPSMFDLEKRNLKINKATRVLWEWYYYGRPQLPENLYYFDYITQESKKIIARTNVDWYTPNLNPKIECPAVEIL